MKKLEEYLKPLSIAVISSFLLLSLNIKGCDEESIDEKRLNQINRIYKKMSQIKDDENVHPEERYESEMEYLSLKFHKLNNSADSIKELLPPTYQLKADSLYENIIGKK